MIPVTLSKDTVYATKPNIMAPEGSTGSDIEAAAQTRMQDALDSQGLDNLTITVGAGAVEVAS